MEVNKFYQLLKNKKQTIISLVALFVLAVTVLSVVQPFKYSSNLRLLAFQSQSNNEVGADPYAMTRANEYLSNILAKVTASNSFYNRVLTSGFDIDQNYFGSSAKTQAKRWHKTISAQAINDTGIIVITAYHSERAQAEAIARAVGHVLMTQHTNYHGLGDNLKIKLLDEPLTSNYPVKPNLALNLILAVVLGLIFSLCYIYLLPEKRYDIKLWPRLRPGYGEQIRQRLDYEKAAAEIDLSKEPAIAAWSSFTEPVQLEEEVIEEVLAQDSPVVEELPTAAEWFMPEAEGERTLWSDQEDSAPVYSDGELDINTKKYDESSVAHDEVETMEDEDWLESNRPFVSAQDRPRWQPTDSEFYR